jgi:D-xylonolactonase
MTWLLLAYPSTQGQPPDITETPEDKMSDQPTPTPLADYACNTGENPTWHPDEERVLWTDIPAGRLFRYDPKTGEHEQFYEGRPVGGFTVQEDGSLLLFRDKGNVVIWRDGQETTILEEIEDERETRFNDVMADPEGRVYCGTMPRKDRLGRLYRLDPDGTLTLLLENIGCSNGMGFTPDLACMYYTDTGTREITLIDYDRGTGELFNGKLFHKTPEGNGEGFPDGMTVDVEGRVWSTRWDGSCMVCIDSNGREVKRIQFPVKKVSSVTFGGPELTDMYITTAGGHQKEQDGEHAGALFHLNLGVKGVPEFRSRVRR